MSLPQQPPPTGPETQQQQAPEAQQQSIGQPKSIEEIQLTALCNWCRNALVMSSPFSDANFIDAGIKWRSSDSDNAEAVYCTDCLADPYRVSNPKFVIDRATLGQGDVTQLPITSS